MKFQVFSQNEWVYPDSPVTEGGTAEFHSARGAAVCCQLLTDHVLQGGEIITADFSMAGCSELRTLRLENVPVDSAAIIASAPLLERVRLSVFF